MTAYRSVADLPQKVDLAILCTPAATVPDLVRQCGESGVGGLVILTAGFREIGAGGRAMDEALRAELASISANAGHRAQLSGRDGARNRSSTPAFAASMPLAGRVAFVSQSGALCTAVLDWACEQSVGFSHFISVGNMLDVDLGDLLDYLADDGNTDAVILYIESITKPAASCRRPGLAPAASRSWPTRRGGSPQSAQAAASHTGAMAGVDSVYEAAFERAGIVRVFEVDDMFDCAELLARGPRVRGDRLAIVTNAGGPGVMACDALLAHNGKLAQLSGVDVAAAQRVACRRPGRTATRSTCWATPRRSDSPGRWKSFRPIRDVDAVLAILTPQAMTDPTGDGQGVVDVARNAHKPILANWMGGRMVREGVDILNKAGRADGSPRRMTPCPAFMHLVRYARNLELLYETPREVPLRFRRPIAPQSRERLQQAFDGGSRSCFTNPKPKSLLAAYGIPVAEAARGPYGR